jgi:hypothetical protein
LSFCWHDPTYRACSLGFDHYSATSEASFKPACVEVCLGSNWEILVMARGTEIERRVLLMGIAASPMSQAAWAQSSLPSASAAQPDIVTAPLIGGLSLSEADSGVREALSLAAIKAGLRLGRTGGYWDDVKVRIPLPAPLDAIQARFAPLKLAMPLDNFQKRLNVAAEAAAPQTTAVLLEAIKSVTMTDALAIVRGPQTAGTDMLKAQATDQLTTMLTEPMADAFAASGAGEAFDRIVARYRREIARLGGFTGLSGYPTFLPTPPKTAQTTSSESDLPTKEVGAETNDTSTAPVIEPAPDPLKIQMIGFSVAKALDGLFLYLAEEEIAIRRDLNKRTTETLRRVFGSV